MALQDLYPNSDYHNEALFTFDGWTIESWVSNGQVRQVFWGRHKPCNGSITGVADPHSHYACNMCEEIMSPETEQVMRNALHMLSTTLVVKEPTIVGLSKSTFPMVGHSDV